MLEVNRKRIRIGVLGCANIASRSVIPAILGLPELYKLLCIASRSEEKAKSFKDMFDIPFMCTYEELIENPDIDAIYIPLPTGLHREWVMAALSHGKHVYVEKSFSFSLSDTRTLIAKARLERLATMEGFMFLYHRQHKSVLGMLEEKLLGDIRHFQAAFSFPELKASNFRYDNKIGGGALYDAACYPLRAATSLFGNSISVKKGIDFRCPIKKVSMRGAALLSDDRGMTAQVSYGFNQHYQCYYEIIGTLGKIRLDRAFTAPPDFKPLLRLETGGETTIVDIECDNHFIGAFREFYRIINDKDSREDHYLGIVRQSELLDSFERIA